MITHAHELPSLPGQMLPSTCIETVETLRDSIGSDLYDRIMQWNDSGAVAALHAKEKKKNGQYIDGEVENWETEEMSPVSVLDLSKKLEREEEEEESTCRNNESCLLDIKYKQQEGEKKPEFLKKCGDSPSLHDVKAVNVGDVKGLVFLGENLKASGRGALPVQLPATDATTTVGGGSSYAGRMFLCGGWPVHQPEKPFQLSRVLESVVPNKPKIKPFGFWKRTTNKVSRKTEVHPDANSTGCSRREKKSSSNL